MRVVIFANGTLNHPEQARELVRADDLVIAADGGTSHAWSIGITPDVVIGDFDSLTPDEQQRLETNGVETISFPARKDETDLELALLHAARAGADEIVILAALGGRLDQTVANLLLLAMPELRDLDVRVVEGPQTAFLIRARASIEGSPGDRVSLIPLGGDAEGVTAQGLEWPLHEDTLHFGPARGVSNVLTEEEARVRVRKGLLLCVVSHEDSR
jgi:thiamine pyrophosphokinase